MDIATVKTALNTEIAYHVYAIAGCLIILAVSAWLAWRELRIVRELSPNDFTRSFSGHEPWTCDGLTKRVNVLTAFKKAKLWNSVRHVGALVILGFIVPSLILGAAVMKSAWLFGGRSPIVMADGVPVAHPTITDAAIFVLSQFLRGISDVLEIFHIDLGHLDVAHGEIIAQAGIFGYRLFVGAFALAILFAIFFLIRVGVGTDNKIHRLNKRREYECRLGGNAKS